MTLSPTGKLKKAVSVLEIYCKSSREAAKMYGIVLSHCGILDNLSGDPCVVNVSEHGMLLKETHQTFKLWRTEQGIYAECEVPSCRVSSTIFKESLFKVWCKFSINPQGGGLVSVKHHKGAYKIWGLNYEGGFINFLKSIV